MDIIKLHLKKAEADAVSRLAQNLNLSPEALVYGALSRTMLVADDPMVRADLVQTWAEHRHTSPAWIFPVHAPEGQIRSPEAETRHGKTDGGTPG